jgi:hypothetical protein
VLKEVNYALLILILHLILEMMGNFLKKAIIEEIYIIILK